MAGLSQGTIKAIEQGKTDARLSTLRKLARTFTAHGVEFVMEGPRNGVTIKNDKPAQVGRALEGASPTSRIAAEAGSYVGRQFSEGQPVAPSFSSCSLQKSLTYAPIRINNLALAQFITQLPTSRLVILREMGPRLGKNRPAAPMKPRVFIMGFPGTGQAGKLDDLNAEKSYGRWAAHMNTVAGNEMLVLDAAKRYPNASYFGLNPGLIKTNIRSNLFGGDTLLYRFIEWMTGLLAPSVETYAERVTPLLVSPDIEGHSGAMFDRKGLAILPTPKLTDSAYVNAFITASEALVSRANVRMASYGTELP